MQDTAGAEFLFELRVFGIIGVLRFLFGIQVIEVAKKLIESVCGGQKLIAIAEVVLAKLPRSVTEGFQ